MVTETTSRGWAKALIEETKGTTAAHEYWGERLEQEGFAIHLAVLVEPFLKYILDGRKTVESRFSANRCAPYRQVNKGDIILLKRAGGSVMGMCEAAQVWCYELEPSSWNEIKSGFAQAICAQDPEFWKDRENAAYATLIRIENVVPLPNLSCAKRDRRGWVVLSSGIQQLTLEDTLS
jgi:hypothetical protein